MLLSADEKRAFDDVTRRRKRLRDVSALNHPLRAEALLTLEGGVDGERRLERLDVDLDEFLRIRERGARLRSDENDRVTDENDSGGREHVLILGHRAARFMA